MGRSGKNYSMIKELVNHQKISLEPTGDPFVDTGAMVIKYLQERNPDKSIIQLIEMATDIYVKHWDNNLHTFFLNSSITHNSNKGQKGIDKTIALYKNFLNGKDVDGKKAEEGFCRITGKFGKIFNGARDNHIMSGSGTLINFHHGFETGIKLSKEALISIFFLPLGVEQLGDKVAVLSSNNDIVSKFFIKRNIENNLKDVASGISNAIQRSEFSNPTNALFDYITQCIESIKIATYDEESETSNTKGVTLNLFHFTNFGASPTISLYTLPATVFGFYAHCYTKYKTDWLNFIFHYYSSSKFKNATFNSNNNTWTNSKEEVDFTAFKVWKNQVYEMLIKGHPLHKLFLKHSQKHRLNFKIIEIYQINIQNMDKKTLSKIKDLANFIVDERSDDEIKKSMTRLNGAKSSHELRYILLKFLGKNYNESKVSPLFTLEDYTEYLFPDGSNWKEMRDLVLIAIYQKLHDVNKKVEVELIENELDNQLNEN
jgi:CRISPR-associated protein Cst1